ncbi:hypothetical protein CHLRE_07g320150v5 [Chlamydomonas reinhardtii]|uniref:Uncharacterized protein n=1 Tax=Chlamydomonas reinhardtii TaxID=3055 RepID=A8I6Y0_CHLRE|nr:uncharacterized protein CHLRE_07g320150v5 [Chlamydomonas reinhardtii]PNW80507.1 hypothetical protein CHLRE_07g320150v5 [Chlamydomonas reinhardtii]|eukprot:XP_001701027.1 ER DnaJ-like protein 1 [Chlamydomonas reinhardtii]
MNSKFAPKWIALLLLGLLLLQVDRVSAKDYYELLQVPKGASEAQLKRAYRKLALQYHPDKVTGTEDEKKVASQRFADINHAYEVLSDPEKRKIYDQYGEDGLKQAQQQGGGHGGGNDLFNFFFGGFGGGQQEEEVRKGHTIYVDLYVTLRDLYVGKELQVVRDKAVIKETSGTRKCNCKTKIMTRQLGPGMFQQFQTQECGTCPAIKLEREQEPITVHVEPGMVNGHQITFFEEGEPLVDGEPGDLVFVVRQALDARFERRGHDLMHNYTISLVDALTGFSHTIDHLDGHKVTLSATGVTRPGDYHQIKGEGMPVHSQEPKRGDMWVQYTVAFPPSLTEEQKAAVRTLFG